jgi:hypothetical protein
MGKIESKLRGEENTVNELLGKDNGWGGGGGHLHLCWIEELVASSCELQQQRNLLDNTVFVVCLGCQWQWHTQFPPICCLSFQLLGQQSHPLELADEKKNGNGSGMGPNNHDG